MINDYFILFCGIGFGLYFGWAFFYGTKPRKKCKKCGKPSYLETCDFCYAFNAGYEFAILQMNLGLISKEQGVPDKEVI